jgi:hypothetical protein
MMRVALIVAGIAALAVAAVLYWRVALFLSFTLLFVGLHSPFVLVLAVFAVGLGVLLWAYRRRSGRPDE